jgi:hypothetical protein
MQMDAAKTSAVAAKAVGDQILHLLPSAALDSTRGTSLERLF